MSNCNEKIENISFETMYQKEQADKRLLSAETFICVIALTLLSVSGVVAAFVQVTSWLKILIAAIGFVVFITSCFFALRIEQMAGYYQCKICKHKCVPTYKSVLFAPHINRTRYMKCPNCNKKSWQKRC